MLLVIDLDVENVIVDVLSDTEPKHKKEKESNNIENVNPKEEVQKQIIDIYGNIVSV